MFVYAVATIKYIDYRFSSPEGRLNNILESPESTVYEGETLVRPNITLDLLYMSILREAFRKEDPKDGPKSRSVLGAVILATNPLSPITIAALLGIEYEEVSSVISAAYSLLVFREDSDSPVRPFHKSFSDFIVDPER